MLNNTPDILHMYSDLHMYLLFLVWYLFDFLIFYLAINFKVF